MTRPALLLLALLLFPRPSLAGGLYGEIRDAKGAPLEGKVVALRCGSAVRRDTTDRYGRYEIRIRQTGHCELTADGSDAVTVTSYEQPSEASFELVNGKLRRL